MATTTTKEIEMDETFCTDCGFDHDPDMTCDQAGAEAAASARAEGRWA